MDFEFARGDTFKFKFRILDQNKEKIELAEGDQLYITCKENSSSTTKIFQKRLGNGITYSDGYYYVTIEPTDTDSLSYTTYGFDIELKTSAGYVKTLEIGSITLTEEYTFKGDE